jgi:hypothetical protein
MSRAYMRVGWQGDRAGAAADVKQASSKREKLELLTSSDFASRLSASRDGALLYFFDLSFGPFGA